METEKINLKKPVYLGLGFGLIAVSLLVLKILFPNPVIEMPPLESFEKPVVLNWDLIRKPLVVEEPSLKLLLSVSSQEILTGEKVGLIAQVEGVSQGPFAFYFDCENDGIFELETEPSFQKKYEAKDLCLFDQEGSFMPKVVVDGFFQFFKDGQEVKEKQTAQAETSILVKSSNFAPIFSACDVDAVEGTTQLNFKFNFSSLAQDPNNDDIKYEWDFGDGNKAEGQNVDYTYKKMGLYFPKVKAIDSKGAFSYCVAKSLTILKGLSSLEPPQKPQRVGRLNPFALVSPEEFLQNEIKPILPAVPTTTQATTTIL